MLQFQCAKQVRIYADVDGKFYYIRILSDIILRIIMWIVVYSFRTLYAYGFGRKKGCEAITEVWFCQLQYFITELISKVVNPAGFKKVWCCYLVAED